MWTKLPRNYVPSPGQLVRWKNGGGIEEGEFVGYVSPFSVPKEVVTQLDDAPKIKGSQRAANGPRFVIRLKRFHGTTGKPLADHWHIVPCYDVVQVKV